MATTVREWTYKRASAAEAGDYLQVMFTGDPDSIARYVLIQTQFEFPQDYDIMIEADDGEWRAKLSATKSRLTRTRLIINGTDDGERIQLVINYSDTDCDYAELKRVLQIMLPVLDAL